jgi:hypothetical protein
MTLQRSLRKVTRAQLWMRFSNLAMFAILLAGLLILQPTRNVRAADLLNANFNSDANGFVYQDDTFGTSQPSYASGARTASGGYGSTGGLQVTLGGVDANTITGISGGWSYTLNLASASSGVKLSFRYKLDQSVDYNYDEFSRVLVKVDGVQSGRGTKNYIDHIGGDGSSTQGSSNTYLPTTDWQQVDIYLGNLAAGSHTLILGGYNNKKNLVTQITTVTLDDVSLSDGNSVPAATPAQILAGRVSSSQFLTYMQGVAVFHDRCRASGMSCSSTDYSTNYMNSVAWIEGQLQAMGYTTVRHTFTSNTGGTNLYATKMGSVTPTQMYMVTAMLDGRGGGDAFDDNASGVALLMEAARVLASPDVTTDKSVRFIFFDKEETGLNGSAAYASNVTSTGGRRALQGTLDEPTWLGLINHDMILYDHGAGTRTTAQSAYADLDVEWRAGTTQEAASKALALKWAFGNGLYAPNYPATAYNYSTNTDDTSFHPYVASISVRENRRSLTSGTNAEWISPYYHQTTDVEASYTRDDNGNGIRDDIELGYNAVRTTLGLVAELAGAHVGTVNNPPVANPQSAMTNEDTAKAITLTGSDADSDPLTYAVVTQPAHGTLSGTAPSLTYTPAANYNGSDSFTFKVNDGKVDSSPATVSITINAVNDPPVANAQAVTTNEDTAKAITLTGSDVDGNPLTYAVLTQPGHGTLSGTAPSLTYTPALNYNGADSFTFKVNDGQVDSAAAAISITVTAVNDAPVANAQSVTTAEDTAKAVTLTGSDVENSPLTFAVVTQPGHGALSGTAPNLTYTPAANYNGSDSFTFKVNDGQVDSATATVSITITPVNDPPVANPQSQTTNEDTSKVITLTGSDLDGDPLNYAVVTQPVHGTLSGTAPAITYTPTADYSGADGFTFKVNDGTVDSAPATVSITVTAVNDSPVADPQSLTTAEDTPLAILLTGSDIDSGSLVFAVTANPSHGTLSGSAPNLMYTPAADFNGSDSFQFVANDGQVNSAPATVVLTVTAVNDTPVADAQTVVTQQDTAMAITLTASDVDSGSLTFTVTADPGHGTLSGSAPSLTYTPASGYIGDDSFSFIASDGELDSAPAAVSITVTHTNHQPAADGQTVVTDEDIAVSITLTGSDPDSDPLTFAVVASPANGSLSGTTPNLLYTPGANFNGTDSFTFVVNDGLVDSVPASVEITVNPVNDAPQANPQSVSLAEDASVAITLSGSDVEGSALTFSVVSGPVHGLLSGIAPDLTYTPVADYNGADSFTFKANDGLVDSTPATVSFTISPVNDAPVANPQSVTATEDTARAITLSGSDVEGSALTYSIVANPSHGALSGTAPNLTYTPSANYNGADSFTFKVNDGTIDSATATVSITVSAVNDAPVANAQAVTTAQDTAKAITLTGSDVEGSALTYSVVTNPAHGSLSGAAPSLTYTPTSGYSGSDSFTFKVNDGGLDSASATVSITITPSGPVTVFSDNFTSNLGWTRNPSGTDTATLGLWERAVPAATDSSGPKQIAAYSATYDLVTGPLAGNNSGSYDIDGGTTTIRSANILLPAGKTLTLTLKYYLAHGNNSSTSDYLRIKVVGTTTTTMLQELGATNDDDAAWATLTYTLTSYAGQTVYILVEAADASGASLVEAAIDDVLITAQ